MRQVRLYAHDLTPESTRLVLNDKAHHYLSRVLRLTPNTEICLFNGKGLESIAKISDIKKNETHCEILEHVDRNNESPLSIHLFQALVRNEKMDWIIQKATELGVKQITPIVSEFCQVKLPKDRLDKRVTHWQDIIISACEQSERSHLPVLNLPVAFSGVSLEENQTAVMLHPREDNRFHPQAKPHHDVAIFIGPEGGFSETEIRLAETWGAEFWCLGPRILRTETAGLAAISVLQSQLGDFQ